MSRSVWNLANCTVLLNANSLHQKLTELFIDAPYDANLFAKIISLCYHIWKARNNNVFRNEAFSSPAIVAIAASTSQDFLIHNPPVRRPPDEREHIKWNPPPPDHVKINFDGSVIQQNNNAAIGFVIRDNFGSPVIACAKRIGKANVPLTEAVALRESLLKAQELNYTNLLIEGDSQLVIHCVIGKTNTPWHLQSIIQDIKQLASNFNSVVFTHTLREANFVANALASIGHGSDELISWTSHFPSSVNSAISFDLFGAGCSRGASL
ncbi:uncharacterized protein LOC112178182 [Rosa chinensis]|uniref:uncharacterized protein LOC112178182 n=1 Tax=Rosa chinensis TaxID=74649 RepID=UPI000D08E53C|nr:uncharacterized protein LOC112178182 [Rosa chinensis]